MFWKKRHPLVKRIFKVFLDKKYEGTYINTIYRDGDILYVNIQLPEKKDRADLEKLLPNLKEEVGAVAVRIGQTSGKYVELQFGMRKLEDNFYSSSLLRMGTLEIAFPSAFGEGVIDFEDGASCHMLNGGVTRMGKTCFLLYLATCIYLQNTGNVRLYISSAKLKDYYPFEGVKGVRMTRDTEGMENMLEEILDEYKKRDELLYSPAFRKATDAKSIRKLYPDSFHLFKPIFLIIDEYARFAESKEIQRMVTEIVETAGFVNVHVIIASQRPDAATVLRPRIRANLLCRMAFTTADRKNSEVILDREGAEKLGKIAGRGMLVDSDMHVIQVPYMDAVECDKLMEEYRDEQSPKRPIDSPAVNKIQSLLSQSDSLLDLQGEQQPDKRSEPSHEEDGLEWLHNPGPEGKR